MVLKRHIVIALGLVILTSGFVIGTSLIPTYHSKYMQKRVKRFYKPLKVKVNYDAKLLDTTHTDIGYYIPIHTEQDSLLGYLCYRQTTACNFGGCVDTTCTKEDETRFKEAIHYYAIISSNDTVYKIGVLEYESTYGYEISSRWWLKQFYNKPTGNFKINDNIDAVSGATISVHAMIDDINRLKSPD